MHCSFLFCSPASERWSLGSSLWLVLFLRGQHLKNLFPFSLKQSSLSFHSFAVLKALICKLESALLFHILNHRFFFLLLEPLYKVAGAGPLWPRAQRLESVSGTGKFGRSHSFGLRTVSRLVFCKALGRPTPQPSGLVSRLGAPR